jgi:putative SOS response-associated peptidase YedK
MTHCNETISPVHDRMSVLLHADEWDQWLHSSFDDALAFKRGASRIT